MLAAHDRPKDMAKARVSFLRRSLSVVVVVVVACASMLAYATHESVHGASVRTFRAPATVMRFRDFDEVFRHAVKVDFCTLETGRVYVPRASMLRRDHSQSDTAREDEPLPIFAYLVRHSVHGDALVDTGLDETFVHDALGNLRAPARLVHGAMHARFALEPGMDIVAQLERLAARPRIAFFTHVHGDHTAGIPALPASMRLVVGPDETDDVAAYLGYGHVTGARVIETLDPSSSVRMAPFEHVTDLFGDGAVLAIATPGHSRGHTSYLVQAKSGPVLVIGDASHTAFAFTHGIGPTGPTPTDERVGQASLDALRAFARAHPSVRVLYGHEAPTRICDLPMR
jgi:N-acyl homoserine lactone hydrolase